MTDDEVIEAVTHLVNGDEYWPGQQWRKAKTGTIWTCVDVSMSNQWVRVKARNGRIIYLFPLSPWFIWGSVIDANAV